MLTKALLEELLEYVPADEVTAVLEETTALFEKWNKVAPNVNDPLNPPHAETLDTIIREALGNMVKRNVKQPLLKAAQASVFLFDPHNKRDWSDPGNSAAAALHIRLGEDSYFLGELRDLKAMKESGNFAMKYKSFSGEEFISNRRFPHWGYEVTHNLTTLESCMEHYRAKLKERRLL